MYFVNFWHNCLKRLKQSDTGNIALSAGIIIPVVLMAVGSAVDYKRAVTVKGEAQYAIDTALLKTAIDMSRADDIEDIDVRERLNETLKLNEDEKLGTIKFVDGKYDPAKNVISGTAQINVQTEFMRIFGFKTIKANVVAGSGPIARPQNFDVAIVLDNTDSISNSDYNLMINAAKSLVNYLHDEKGTSGLRIGIVPFSRYVNIGDSNTGADWVNYNNSYNPDLAPFEGCVHPYFDSRDADATQIPNASEPLDAAYDYKKYPYNSAPPSAQNNPLWWKYKWDVNNCRIAPIQTMTDSRSTAIAAVDALKYRKGGATYLPAGLKWGHLVVNDLSPIPSATPAPAYAKKSIIFMTDGGNKLYWMRKQQSPELILTDAENDTHTKTLCDGIKKTGTSIMVIGYKYNPAVDEFKRAEEVLNDCVSSPGLFLKPDDQQSLLDAFADLGEKVIYGSIRLFF